MVGRRRGARRCRWCAPAPVSYRGEEALQARHRQPQGGGGRGGRERRVFMPAVAPSGVGANEYYKTEEEYFHAVGDAMRDEYKAIVDAGFILQIDDPFLSELFADPRNATTKERRARARDVRRGDEPRAARHPAGEGALPHLLRHQRGPAHPRRRRSSDIVDIMLEGQRRRLLLRGGEPAPRARVPPLGDRQAPDGQGAHPRRHHAREQHRRAPGADRRAHRALRERWSAARTSSPAPTAASRLRRPTARRCTRRSCGRSSRRCARARAWRAPSSRCSGRRGFPASCRTPTWRTGQSGMSLIFELRAHCAAATTSFFPEPVPRRASLTSVWSRITRLPAVV